MVLMHEYVEVWHLYFVSARNASTRVEDVTDFRRGPTFGCEVRKAYLFGKTTSLNKQRIQKFELPRVELTLHSNPELEMLG